MVNISSVYIARHFILYLNLNLDVLIDLVWVHLQYVLKKIMGHLLFFLKEAIFQCVAFSIQNTYKTLIHFILIDRLSAPSNLFHFLFCSTSFKANYSSNLNLRPMRALIIHIVIFLHRSKPQTGSF